MLDDDNGGDDLADDVLYDKNCCEDDRENQQERKGLKLLPLIHTRARATIILFCKRSQIKIKYSMHAGQRFRSLAQFSTLVH